MIGASRRNAALAAAIAAIVLALSIAGCGGGSSSTTSATADAQQLQVCLEQQGVQLPSGAPSGTPPSGRAPSGQPPSGGLPGGVNPQKMQKAFQACQQYAPQGAPAGGLPSPPSGQQ
jgi:hypothetical protein